MFPYHIIFSNSNTMCVHKGGCNGEAKRVPERERLVPRKCKSITYRKQFRLAQVQRKLEKAGKPHS